MHFNGSCEIRAEVIVLMTLPQNFTRQTLNGTLNIISLSEYAMLRAMKWLFWFQEEGSNFLSESSLRTFKDIKS